MAGRRIGMALLAIGWSATGFGQVVEREAVVVGPGGRTIERESQSVRTPRGTSRDLTIRRPAGTLHRQAFVSGPRPGPWLIQRNVIVSGGGPDPVLGVVAPFFGALAGAAAGTALMSRPAPATTVLVPAPAPVVVAPPRSGVLVVETPAPAMALPTAPAVIDPVPDELERLQSWNGNTRVEAIKALGRLGDPRAVPPLIKALRDDRKDEVREHAAWALGLIGEPAGRAYLEVAAESDPKPKVREAAARGLTRPIRSTVVIQEDAAPVAPPSRSPFSWPGGAVPTPAPPSPMPPDGD